MNRRDVVAGGGVDARALDSLENCCHGAHPGIDAQTDLSVTRGRIMFEVVQRSFKPTPAALNEPEVFQTRPRSRVGEREPLSLGRTRVWWSVMVAVRLNRRVEESPSSLGQIAR